MRKIVIITLTFGFLINCVMNAQAFWWDKKKEEKQPRQEVVPKSEEEQLTKEEKEAEQRERSLKEKRALIDNKRQQLNNIEWEIKFTLLSGKEEGKKESDTIIFSNNKVASANLISQGFSPSNYTMTVQEDGGVIWETMQTSAKSGIAFWRGEIDKNLENMQGILSHKIDDKTTKDYTFLSINKKAISPPLEE